MPRFKDAQSGAVVSVSDATAALLGREWRPLDDEFEQIQTEGNGDESDTGNGDDSEPFDPSKHNGDVVSDYLANADDQERERVLEAERAGKNRKTIVGD